MEKLGQDKIDLIKDLRSKGHTLTEIKKVVRAGKGTISKYIKDVPIDIKFKDLFALKRFSSKRLSITAWGDAKIKANEMLPSFKKDHSLIALSALYWGEGNKKELSLINSDPSLIKVFVECLYLIGVKKDSLKITLRVYEDNNISKTKKFWAKLLRIPLTKIDNVNIIKGKKKGKLKFGMCRIRVKKGGQYFKLIISMINLLKSHHKAAVVQWIEQDTPNV